MKYKDYLSYWLNTYVKPSVKPRTLTRYGHIIELHIRRMLGEYEINELTPFILQGYVTDLLQSGNLKTGGCLSANSVNGIISIIQSSLKAAHILGLTDIYSADKIKRPRLTEKRVDCFTIMEQKQLEKYVLTSNKDKLFGVILCLYTGLRIGELLSLNWADIDFIDGTLHISKSCHDSKGGLAFDEPKTAHSCRIIPLPKQLVPFLKNIKRRANSPFVISSMGKPISVRSYQRSFELLQRRLGIAHKGFHSLRHTFATRAIECGMDVKTLSEILGHKNPTITLNRYVHSLFEHKRSMMNRLGKLF